MPVFEVAATLHTLERSIDRARAWRLLDDGQEGDDTKPDKAHTSRVPVLHRLSEHSALCPRQMVHPQALALRPPRSLRCRAGRIPELLLPVLLRLATHKEGVVGRRDQLQSHCQDPGLHRFLYLKY